MALFTDTGQANGGRRYVPDGHGPDVFSRDDGHHGHATIFMVAFEVSPDDFHVGGNDGRHDGSQCGACDSVVCESATEKTCARSAGRPART